MLLTIYLCQVSDHHIYKSGVVSRFAFLNSILNVASAVLSVGAESSRISSSECVFKILIQDGFVCVADLKILLDHPSDLPSREKAFFFLCRFFFDNSSFEVSVGGLLRPPA